jgi:transposase
MPAPMVIATVIRHLQDDKQSDQPSLLSGEGVPRMGDEGQSWSGAACREKGQLRMVNRQVLENDRRIIAAARASDVGRRLMEAPGVGPVLASAFVARAPTSCKASSSSMRTRRLRERPRARKRWRGPSTGRNVMPKRRAYAWSRCSLLSSPVEFSRQARAKATALAHLSSRPSTLVPSIQANSITARV